METLNLETKRCIIRNFKETDIEDLYSILSDSKVMEYIETPFNFEKTEKFLYENGLTKPFIIFALEFKETKKLIGQIIFNEYENNKYEIGWILDSKYWKKGIANEVTKALIDYSKVNNVTTLLLECDKQQKASQKIALKNNFKEISRETLIIYELVLKDIKQDGVTI